MNWTDLQSILENYLNEEPPSADLTAAFPVISQNGDLRCQREIDFAAMSGENTSKSLIAGSATFDLSTLTGQTVGGFPCAYQYPVEVYDIAANVGGSWVQFFPVSLAFLRYVWPNPSTTGTPGTPFAYYTVIDQKTLLVAPTPASTYSLRVTGKWRAAALSSTVSETYLGDVYPELLMAACMVEAYGYRRDYGSQSDDPKAAVSWEALYQQHKASAIAEEQGKQLYGRAPPPVTVTPV